MCLSLTMILCMSYNKYESHVYFKSEKHFVTLSFFFKQAKRKALPNTRSVHEETHRTKSILQKYYKHQR